MTANVPVKRYIWNASDVPYDSGYFTSDDGVQPDPEDKTQFVLASAHDAVVAERDALRALLPEIEQVIARAESWMQIQQAGSPSAKGAAILLAHQRLLVKLRKALPDTKERG